MTDEPTTTQETTTESAAPVAEPVSEDLFKPEITFDDFQKLDLRVATITHAEAHPNADRLLRVQVDDGSADGRQICAGIKAWYEPESLIGKQVVIVANLKPRKIRGEISNGMILAATTNSADDQENVIVLGIDRPAKPGSSVS